MLFAGAFLVPYILMVFVIGLPIFFAELFVGQYGGLGPIKAYTRLAPFFHGTQKNILNYINTAYLLHDFYDNKYTKKIGLDMAPAITININFAFKAWVTVH